MKKILYVYTSSSIGGGSYAMLNIIKALDRTKYKPIVLLQSMGPLVEELKTLEVEVYFLTCLNTVPYNESLLTISNIARCVRIYKSFRRFDLILKQINPDIVYLNTMMLHPYLKFVKARGIKSIIHIREHWPEGDHIVQRNCAIRNIRLHSDEIVAINEYSASMIADKTHHPTIIYDWIDMSARYGDTTYDSIFSEDCSVLKVYLCTGGYDPIKGTLDVVNAFRDVVDDPFARLLVLGTRPVFTRRTGIRYYLRNKRFCRYADQLDQAIAADSRIKILPNTYYVSNIYKNAYCVLSYFKIPHANLALAESIILGTPVIAARNEESVEYSYNEELAILFNPNDPKDFKEKIKAFQHKRASLIMKLENKSEFIENKFSPQENISRLAEIYDRIS